MQGATASVPHPRSAVELQRVVVLDRLGAPYLLYRDHADTQIEVPLASRTRLTIGRDPVSDVSLPWDRGVSRLHAELERRTETWLLIDDGMSTNGTFINGEPVRSRRRLVHGDALLLGKTVIVFRAPAATEEAGTVRVQEAAEVPVVTPAQQRVLEELCRPFVTDPAHAFPPTNVEVAAALVVSERAVKSQLRKLFHSFGIEDLPQNAKRARLIELALDYGIVGTRRRADR